ncbi:MAG: ABC transporter permease [Anaerolineae bacterium]
MSTTTLPEQTTARIQAPPPRPRRRWRRRLRGNELGVAGAIILICLVLIAIFAPYLTPYDPVKLSLAQRLRPPGLEHLLGTDEFGRDFLARVLYGSRISLLIVVTVIGLAGGVGIILGAIGGYRGGRWDEGVMRTADVFMAFPDLVLAMALSAALGADLRSAIIAVAIVSWPTYARLVRGQMLTLKHEAFVEAARASGASEGRIILRHLLPNTMSPLLVRMTTDAGYAILYAASLGFIGLGAQEPLPEWGRMVATGRAFMIDQWWYPFAPGMAIFLAVLGFIWFGDGLRDWLDPRLNK